MSKKEIVLRALLVSILSYLMMRFVFGNFQDANLLVNGMYIIITTTFFALVGIVFNSISKKHD